MLGNDYGEAQDMMREGRKAHCNLQWNTIMPDGRKFRDWQEELAMLRAKVKEYKRLLGAL